MHEDTAALAPRLLDEGHSGLKVKRELLRRRIAVVDAWSGSGLGLGLGLGLLRASNERIASRRPLRGLRGTPG